LVNTQLFLDECVSRARIIWVTGEDGGIITVAPSTPMK
jgi:hypothetical protein